jgi:hypothetical protein
LIDYQAGLRRNDGEWPGDDLETDHESESNSCRVEVPGLNKIQPEQRRYCVQNSAPRTWNMEEPPHQTNMGKTNEKKRGNQGDHVRKEQAGMMLGVAGNT